MEMLRVLRVKICCGRQLSIPIKSHLEKGISIYTNDGGIRIGSHFSTSNHVHLSALAGGKLTIGDRVFFNRNVVVVCRNRISIGNHTIFGPNICIYDHDHCFNYAGVQSGYKLDEVVIEDNCWIGAGSIILKGTHIGEGCVIGAGCIIKGNIPAHSIVTMDRDLMIRELRRE